MKRVLFPTIVAVSVVAAVLTFFLAAPSQVNAGGFVPNPGFEDTLGSEWYTEGAASRVCSSPVHEGSCAAQISGSDGKFMQWVAVAALGRYECWGSIYATGNVTGTIELQFWKIVEGNQTSISAPTELKATNTGGSYVQNKVNIRAPVGTTHLRIRLLGNGTWDVGQEVRFDDIGVNPPNAGCFIATAAYGTDTAEQIDVLRAFRDQVLLDNPVGSRLVAWYYWGSPPVANFVLKHDFLRTGVRELLVDPVVDIARLTQSIWGD